MGEFVVGIFKLLNCKVIHALCVECPTKQKEYFSANVGVTSGLLEVWNGITIFTGIIKSLTKIEAHFGVGWVLLHSFLAFPKALNNAGLLNLFQLVLQFLVVWIISGSCFNILDVLVSGLVLDFVGLGAQGDIPIRKFMGPTVK